MAPASSRRHPPSGTDRGRSRVGVTPRGGRGSRHGVVPIRPLSNRRLLAVYGLLVAGLFGLAGRLAWLQVVQGANLEARARAIQTHTVPPLRQRRTIVDRMGRLVALDEERFTLWVHPRYFNLPGDDPQSVRPVGDVVTRLAAVLAQP
ncbi:MAG: penicillin-binding protein 2, partial [Cyanobium sp.]